MRRLPRISSSWRPRIIAIVAETVTNAAADRDQLSPRIRSQGSEVAQQRCKNPGDLTL